MVSKKKKRAPAKNVGQTIAFPDESSTRSRKITRKGRTPFSAHRESRKKSPGYSSSSSSSNSPSPSRYPLPSTSRPPLPSTSRPYLGTRSPQPSRSRSPRPGTSRSPRPGTHKSPHPHKTVSPQRTIIAPSQSTSSTTTSNISKRKNPNPRKAMQYTDMIVGNKKYKLRWALIQEIKKLQSSVATLVPKLSFARVVREVMMDCNPNLRIQLNALSAIQESAEMYLVDFLQDSYLCTLHAHRVTLKPQDMQLVKSLRGM